MDLNFQGNAGAEAVAAVIMAKYDTDRDRGRELDAMLRSNDVVPAELATQLRAVQSVDDAGPPAEPAQRAITSWSSAESPYHNGSEATAPRAGSPHSCPWAALPTAPRSRSASVSLGAPLVAWIEFSAPTKRQGRGLPLVSTPCQSNTPPQQSRRSSPGQVLRFGTRTNGQVLRFGTRTNYSWM